MHRHVKSFDVSDNAIMQFLELFPGASLSGGLVPLTSLVACGYGYEAARGCQLPYFHWILNLSDSYGRGLDEALELLNRSQLETFMGIPVRVNKVEEEDILAPVRRHPIPLLSAAHFGDRLHIMSQAICDVRDKKLSYIQSLIPSGDVHAAEPIFTASRRFATALGFEERMID